MLDRIEKKIEIINGREVMMSPAGISHNRIERNLSRIISTYLRGKRCEMFFETKVVFDEKNHYIPDLVVVCDPKKIKRSCIEGTPDFIVEILSPATRKNDVGEKKNVYEHFGVGEYWIIDPISRVIDVYLLQNGRYELDNSYHAYQAEDWEELTAEEQAEAKLSLKLSLYDDLEILVKEVFET